VYGTDETSENFEEMKILIEKIVLGGWGIHCFLGRKFCLRGKCKLNVLVF